MRAAAIFTEANFLNNVTRTMLQVIAGTNHGIKMTEFGVSFQGVDNIAKPVKIEILRQTTAGTSSALTAVKMSDTTTGIDTSALQTFTGAEPASGDVLRTFFIHPQQGLLYAPPDPEEFEVGGGTRLAMRVTIESGETNLDAVGYMEWDE